MKIKSFILIIYTFAGLFIAAFTAFATYIIIGAPIGMKMVVQILIVIIFILPIIAFISYVLGRYLSVKFNFIKDRLKNIEKENFIKDESKSSITEINQINNSMNFLASQMDNLIEDLKQKNQNLSNMLISMAHDVKTPITILNGYVEEIEDGLVDELKLPIVLAQMKREIAFLNELTVDMLDFITSMENHKTKESINLYDLVENEVFPLLQPKENIEYKNEIKKDFVLYFNKMDLKKICINLLINAIKYTQKGYIKVSVEQETVLFENSGDEIAPEYKEKIFEPFFTISKSKNRKESGFGLGLSIVKNLSHNNQYNCFLKSSSDKKTVFCLKLNQKKVIE